MSDPVVDMKFDGKKPTWTVIMTKYCQNLDWAMYYTWGKKNRIVVIKANNIPHTFNDNYSSDDTKVVARYNYDFPRAHSMNDEAKKNGFNIATMRSQYNIPSFNKFTYPDAWIFMPQSVTKHKLQVDTVFHLEYNSASYGSTSSHPVAKQSINTNFQGLITNSNFKSVVHKTTQSTQTPITSDDPITTNYQGLTTTTRIKAVICKRTRKKRAPIDPMTTDFTYFFADSSSRSNVSDLKVMILTVFCVGIILFG